MKNKPSNPILNSPLLAYAHHRIIADDNDVPVDYVFLEVNEAFEKMTGLVADEVINKTVTIVMPDITTGEFDWISIYGKVALTGEEMNFEQYSKPLDRWYNVFVFSPKKYYFTTFFTDITRTKKTREQEQLFNLALDQSPASIVITDFNANIEFVNKKFCDISGYSYEELIGNNPNILSSGKQSVDFYVNFWKTLTSGQVWEGELINKRKNGDLFWEYATISPVKDSTGRTTHYFGVKEDITSRKANEKLIHKFSKIIENSPNMILITDSEFKIEYVNPSFCLLSGYSFEEITGRTYKFLRLANEDRAANVELWQKIEAKDVWRGEIIDKRKGGELYWQDLTINTINDINGNVVNYVAIMQDVTERKKIEGEIKEINLSLEQKVKERTSELSVTNEFLMNEIIIRKKHEAELKVARNDAEKANKAKSEFISRMSHELRTPMNSILGFAQLFSMGELNDMQKKGVEHILNSGNHLLKLINEVLDISKIESGKLSLSIELVKIKEIVEEAVDLVRPLTVSKNISILVDLKNCDNLSIKVDKQRLLQVIINLLNNAIKYNVNDGSVTLKVDIEKDSDSTENKIKISVIDTGIGVEEKNLIRLFTHFERMEEAINIAEGTGLGLSIAKELIELMNGTIAVTSKVGEGSTFYILLPYEDNKHNEFQLDNFNITHNSKGKNNAKGTILYIEDNNSNIELVQQIISTYRPDIKLICHKYGLKAVDLAIKHDPNLILLDLNLPDSHGSEIIVDLKKNKNTRHIPVIVISADAMPYRISNLINSGAERYLTKPLDVVELLSEIDKYKIN
ncbi:MAG: hypothetical protein BGO29_05265 [Bacteroidales bacterium 36-12]|nr:MAG: hypothetical protein BGO29_05265 [Bacteroidales bacterium 36-12]